MKTTTKRAIKRWSVRAAIGLGLGVVAFLGVVMVDSWTPSGSAPSGARLERVQRAERYQGGKFVDFLPRTEPEFWPTLSRWLAGAPNTIPSEPVPVERGDVRRFGSAPETGLRITWLGHSSVLVEIDGANVLLDPVWSERCSPLSFIGPVRFHPPPLALDELPELDAVVISHDHYDHLDYDTIIELSKRNLQFVVPLGVGAHLEYWGIDPARITELEWWQSFRVGQVDLTATPSRHFSGRSLVMADRDQTLWAGWALLGPEHRVFYSGDTAMFPEFEQIGARLGPFQATLLEVGAYNQLWADVHLGPEQALRAHQMVRGDLLVPVHWGTFDLALHAWTEPMERLLVGAAEKGIRLASPRPGESIEPARAPAAARWWPAVPWQTREEAPVVSSGL